MSMFSAVEMAPRDPILGLNEQFAADTNPHKVNLGVGVYFDDNGKLPLLACVQAAEKALNDSLKTVVPQANAAFDAGDLTASLQALAALKAPVDAFFDGVMVNAEDAALKANRLGLLATLHAAMNRVADLSRLAA